jgi:hypothetical protein
MLADPPTSGLFNYSKIRIQLWVTAVFLRKRKIFFIILYSTRRPDVATTLSVGSSKAADQADQIRIGIRM